MNTHFIDEKAKSKLNLHALLSPVVAFLLLTVGEIVGGFLFLPAFLFGGLDDFSFLVISLFVFAFISLAVLLWARLVEKSPWQGLGLFRQHALRDFGIGWALGGGMLTLCVLLMMAVGGVTITKVEFTPLLLGQFLILILAWSIQGTTEELVTRGWMFSSLSAKHSIPVGMLVSSVFFTAIHLGNNAISFIPLLDLTLFAVLACLLMLKTGNLWVISGWHAAWNCFQGNVFAFPVSGTEAGAAFIQVHTQGPEWLSGGAFGVEGSLVSVLVQTAVILWLIYDLYYKNRNKTSTTP